MSTSRPSGTVLVTEIDRALWAPAVFSRSSLQGNSTPKLISDHKQEPSPSSVHGSTPAEAQQSRLKRAKDTSGPRIRNDLNSCFSNPTFWAIVVLAFAGLLAIRFGVEDEPAPDSIEAFDKNFAILGLSFSATDEEVKQKYKELALKYHPDKCNDSAEECKDKFIAIKKAKESILKHGKYWKAQRVINTSKIPNNAAASAPKKPKSAERPNPWSS